MDNFNIRFRDINEDEYKKFIEWGIESYSKDLMKSEAMTEKNALKESKASFDRLLPKGIHTKDSYIYVAENTNNESVGIIWYSKYRKKISLICDFVIFEKFRKQGYGRQTLLLAEKDAKEKGFNQMVLNVFKYNESAFSLYKSVGYEICHEENEAVTMLKDI